MASNFGSATKIQLTPLSINAHKKNYFKLSGTAAGTSTFGSP